MVAVDDLDPPGEAKIKSESTGVPPSAPPKEAFAERADAWGTSSDVPPEDTYGEAEGNAYAINRARAHFRRFSNGMHMIMAVRTLETPRKTEVMQAPNAIAEDKRRGQ